MQTNNGQLLKNEWILPTTIFVGVCALFMGKIWVPILFVAWVALGWKISMAISRTLVVGKEGVKKAAGIGIYLAVIALINALAVIF